MIGYLHFRCVTYCISRRRSLSFF